MTRNKILFWITLPLSIISIGEFFLSWRVALVLWGVLFVIMLISGLSVKKFFLKIGKIVWVTFPLFLFTFGMKKTGLFLGWFYLDPILEYGVFLIRLVNFTLAFWMLQEFWYIPWGKGWDCWIFRIFWKSFSLVMDMWSDILRWPRERFSLRELLERRYEWGIKELDQVFDKNIDNVYTKVKE